MSSPEIEWRRLRADQLRDMARRFASVGYYVMLPNLYYRSGIMELGPLPTDPESPERKRMFMAMKREVLKLGGYAREFFVSQTPELTAMADAVIDLEVFAAARDSVVAA